MTAWWFCSFYFTLIEARSLCLTGKASKFSSFSATYYRRIHLCQFLSLLALSPPEMVVRSVTVTFFTWYRYTATGGVRSRNSDVHGSEKQQGRFFLNSSFVVTNRLLQYILKQIQCMPRLTLLIRLTWRRYIDNFFSLTETEGTVRPVPAYQVRHPPPPHPGRHQGVWRQDAPQVSIST